MYFWSNMLDGTLCHHHQTPNEGICFGSMLFIHPSIHLENGEEHWSCSGGWQRRDQGGCLFGNGWIWDQWTNRNELFSAAKMSQLCNVIFRSSVLGQLIDWPKAWTAGHQESQWHHFEAGEAGCRLQCGAWRAIWGEELPWSLLATLYSEEDLYGSWSCAYFLHGLNQIQVIHHEAVHTGLDL